MLYMAVGWELLDRTNSAMALGMKGLFLGLPTVFFLLPAGHVSDRFSRRDVLMLTQVVTALSSFGLMLIAYFKAPVPWIYATLLLAGVSQAFNNPARWSLAPQLVPSKDFANSVTWSSTFFQIASVVGPAVGGFLLALWGTPFVFFLDGVCALVFVGLLLAVPRDKPSAPKEKITLRSLAAGLDHVWKTKTILAIITLDLFAVLIGGAVGMLPIFARDILHCGKIGFGFLQAAPAFGAVGMAFLLSHLPIMKKVGKTLLWAVTGFGLTWIFFGLSETFGFSLFLLFVGGALDNISVVIRGTLVQVLTPNSLRGRVSSVNSLFINTSNYLGDFESGLTTQLWGPVRAVVIGGIGTLLIVVSVMAIWPELLKLGPLKGKESS